MDLEVTIVVASSCGGERSGEFLFSGYRVSFCKLRKLWNQIVVIVAQQCECT
jgi:hypothetical protein